MPFLISKWPSRSQWRQFFKVFSKREKTVFFVFSFFALVSLLFLSVSFYLAHTEIQPDNGGNYVEGVVGSPRLINPLYPSRDVDRDLIELIYSGLMKYDGESQLATDLVEDYKILDNGKAFEFYLKENLLWSDGNPLTADDIIFTVKAVQNQSLHSSIRAKWLGVKVEKISDLAVRFELSNPSAVFLENCTLKIMPKHIWENISEQNFSLSIYNLKPIGSGPYKIKELQQDKEGAVKSAKLTINGNYQGNLPNIREITLLFFNNEDELISAFNSGKIKGLALSSPQKYEKIKKNSFSDYQLMVPSYFAVFFNNEQAKVLADQNIREALNYGTNKEEIINELLAGQGRIADSPILPDVFGFESPSSIYSFDLEKAKELLETAGFAAGESGIREKTTKKESSFQFKSNLQSGSQGTEVQELQKCLAKDPEVYPEGEITGHFGDKTKEAVIRFQEKYKEDILVPNNLTEGNGKVLGSTKEKLNELCAAPSEQTASLSFTLTTADQPIMKNLAALLKKQWQAMGVEININALDTSTLEQEVIKPRSYELLLFGQGLELFLDPFPYWHSSQIKDPGFNLSNYENKEADNLLAQARQTLDQEERKMLLEKFQNILIEDAPAVFLYSPDYIYLVSEKIKGISDKIITDPSKRFSDVGNWYIKTKRVWK
ncbi:MAG TPA: ABC transporter substrate-binding protein [Candidatus Paceibacterota bacterium]|nr:ABC transporter substrate-binding protein [Candidatus Paceibacterota bacterium]